MPLYNVSIKYNGLVESTSVMVPSQEDVLMLVIDIANELDEQGIQYTEIIITKEN